MARWLVGLGLLLLSVGTPKADHCPEVSGRWAWGPVQTLAVDGGRIVFANGLYLQVAELVGPAELRVLGEVMLPDPARGIALAGDLAYAVSGRSGLQVVDLSDPSRPAIVGALDTPGQARGVARSGDRAWIADGDAGLQVVDVSDPATPVIEFSLPLDDAAHGVDFADGRLYAATEHGLQVFPEDPGDPPVPPISSLRFPYAFNVTVDAGFAYLATISGLFVLELSGSAEPVLVGAWGDDPDHSYSIGDVVVRGGHAVISDLSLGRTEVLDISDPTRPARVAHLDVAAHASYRTLALAADRLIIAAGPLGLRVADISDPLHPEPLSFLAGSGYHRGLAVADGLAVILDSEYGFAVFDVSGPGAPRRTTIVQIPYSSHATDVVIGNDHVAFVAGSAYGVYAYDLSPPGLPVLLDSLRTIDGSRRHPNALAITGELLLAAFDRWGIVVYDVGNPSAIEAIGELRLSPPFTDLAVDGSIVYATTDWAGMVVIDIGDPAHPVEIGQTAPDRFYSVTLSGTLALLAGGSDGLVVYDVSSPEAPVEVGSYDFDDPENWVSSVAVVGRLVFVNPYYAYEWGSVRVLDLRFPATPRELGRFLGGDQQLAAADGLVYVSDREGGLATLDPSRCGFEAARPEQETVWLD